LFEENEYSRVTRVYNKEYQNIRKCSSIFDCSLIGKAIDFVKDHKEILDKLEDNTIIEWELISFYRYDIDESNKHFCDILERRGFNVQLLQTFNSYVNCVSPGKNVVYVYKLKRCNTKRAIKK